jgi:hypothetical protein
VTSIDPAGVGNESTGSHAIPLHLRAACESAGEHRPQECPAYEPPARNILSAAELISAGLWFSPGKAPDGMVTLVRVDDPESPVFSTNDDTDNRNRHLLRALLRHTLDMLDGEDNS